MPELGSLSQAIVSGVFSGALISAVLGALLIRKTARIQAEIKNQSERALAIFKSTRGWKEQALSELLGPLYMQFDRSERAFMRWRGKNLYVEAKVIREANVTIRDQLLIKAYLIPPELLDDAGKLVEHYDRWLEEFDRVRTSTDPNLDEPFVFVGPKGFPFPSESEKRFRDTFKRLWSELYG